MSNPFIYHILFGSNILGGKSIFSYVLKKMAHKKTLLNKFHVESDSNDCRSPRHDGQKWYIPETSFSEDIKNTNTSEEDPDVNVNPSTSSQSNCNQITIQNGCTTSSTIPIQPPNKRDVHPETNSSGSWKYFNTDDSPISGSTSKKLIIILCYCSFFGHNYTPYYSYQLLTIIRKYKRFQYRKQ